MQILELNLTKLVLTSNDSSIVLNMSSVTSSSAANDPQYVLLRVEDPNNYIKENQLIYITCSFSPGKGFDIPVYQTKDWLGGDTILFTNFPAEEKRFNAVKNSRKWIDAGNIKMLDESKTVKLNNSTAIVLKKIVSDNGSYFWQSINEQTLEYGTDQKILFEHIDVYDLEVLDVLRFVTLSIIDPKKGYNTNIAVISIATTDGEGAAFKYRTSNILDNTSGEIHDELFAATTAIDNKIYDKIGLGVRGQRNLIEFAYINSNSDIQASTSFSSTTDGDMNWQLDAVSMTLKNHTGVQFESNSRGGRIQLIKNNSDIDLCYFDTTNNPPSMSAKKSGFINIINDKLIVNADSSVFSSFSVSAGSNSGHGPVVMIAGIADPGDVSGDSDAYGVDLWSGTTDSKYNRIRVGLAEQILDPNLFISTNSSPENVLNLKVASSTNSWNAQLGRTFYVTPGWIFGISLVAGNSIESGQNIVMDDSDIWDYRPDFFYSAEVGFARTTDMLTSPGFDVEHPDASMWCFRYFQDIEKWSLVKYFNAYSPARASNYVPPSSSVVEDGGTWTGTNSSAAPWDDPEMPIDQRDQRDNRFFNFTDSVAGHWANNTTNYGYGGGAPSMNYTWGHSTQYIQYRPAGWYRTLVPETYLFHPTVTPEPSSACYTTARMAVNTNFGPNSQPWIPLKWFWSNTDQLIDLFWSFYCPPKPYLNDPNLNPDVDPRNYIDNSLGAAYMYQSYLGPTSPLDPPVF